MEKKTETDVAIKLLYALIEFGQAVQKSIPSGLAVELMLDSPSGDTVELTADDATRHLLAENLKSLGITHKDLAKQMGVSTSIVRKVLRVQKNG